MKPSSRTFYRRTVTIEILSENPIEEMSIETLAYAIGEGDCSGQMHWKNNKEMTGAQMAKALMSQGSDPEFFMLDENGQDLSDEDE